MNSPFAECRRVRPLLGTLVRVEATAGSTNGAALAVEAAFAAVAEVHAALNAHDPSSDLGRIGRAAGGQTLAVRACTWRLLNAARALSACTRGLFDPTVDPLDCASQSRTRPDWRDLELPAPGRVHLRRAVRLDCGGIAKGFAIDTAIRALRASGALGGLVEAGGDLRSFGTREHTIHVRRPLDPAAAYPVLALVEGASATSAPRHDGESPWMATVDPRAGKSIAPRVAVTVAAPRATWADALTKVVALDPANCAPLLARLGAQSLVIDSGGGAQLLAPASTRTAGWRWLGAGIGA